MSIGDDIVENQLKLYVAFKKIKNIICTEVYQNQILLHLRLNTDNVELEEGFIRDVSGVGHFGTGDLGISIKSTEEFEKAKALIDKGHELN